MILIDRPLWYKDGERWSHLVSNVSFEELHSFVDLLGVPRKAFQGDHYDIPERLLARSIELGAVLVDPRRLLSELKAAGLRKPSTPNRPLR